MLRTTSTYTESGLCRCGQHVSALSDGQMDGWLDGWTAAAQPEAAADGWMDGSLVGGRGAVPVRSGCAAVVMAHARGGDLRGTRLWVE